MEAQISRAFPFLAYLIAVLVVGNAVLTMISPFAFFVMDSEFRSSILAANYEGVVSILLNGWSRLHAEFSLYAILLGGFFVGFVIEAFGRGFIHFQSRFTRLKFVEKIPAEPVFMMGTKEYAEFLVWLTENPKKKGYWDWELFFWTLEGRLFALMILFTITYAIFYVGDICYQYFLISSLSVAWILTGLLIIALVSCLTVFIFYAFVNRTQAFVMATNVLYGQFKKRKFQAN